MMWHKIKPYIKRHKKLLILSVIIIPILSGLNLLQPYLMKIAIDNHILNKDMGGLRFIALIYFGVFTFEYILNFCQIYIMQLTGQRIIYDLRKDCFQKIQELDASYFDQTPVGITLTRLTGDCEVISDFFASGIVSLGWDIFRLIFTVILMAYLDWRLTLITFSVIPVLLVVVIIFRKLLREGYDRVREKLAALNVFIQEHVSGIRIIQLFRKEAFCKNEFMGINHSYRNANMTTIRYDALLYALVEALASVAIGLIIWYGGGSIIQGMVTFGVLVAFIEYIQRFFIPIRDLSSKFAIIQSARVAFRRIFHLLDHPIQIRSPEFESTKVQEVQGFAERLRIQDISFEYPSKNRAKKRTEKPVLDHIRLDIRRGEKIGLVGVTGSGKSTLLKLLNRTYEAQSGEITLDGVALRDFSLKRLRSLFGVVPQDVFLFSGSVLDNIRLFKEEYPLEEVVKTAKKVGVHEFIERLPRGYHQKVSPRGGNLSMGERQLIAMARGVLFQAPILLLDEATAHVDPMTTHLIQEALDRIREDHTLVVAAHRLSTVRHMDRILVMHQGRLKESGGHEELLKKGGVYAQLWKMEPISA